MSKDQVNDSVREEFRKLSLDAKTAFLVEAIFSTAGSAINEIGGRLTSLVSLVTEPFEAGEEPGEAPEAASEAGSDDESGGRSSSAKKGSSKRGTGKGGPTEK